MVGLLHALATIVVALVVGLVTVLLYAALRESPVWHFGWTGFAAFLVTRRSPCSAASRSPRCCSTPLRPSWRFFFVYRWVLPGSSLGTALIGWFGSRAPWIDFPARRAGGCPLRAGGGQWLQLFVTEGVIGLVGPCWGILAGPPGRGGVAAPHRVGP